MILRKNAKWLDGSGHTDIDELYNVWTYKMIGASAFIEKQGIEETNELFGRQYKTRKGKAGGAGVAIYLPIKHSIARRKTGVFY